MTIEQDPQQRIVYKASCEHSFFKKLSWKKTTRNSKVPYRRAKNKFDDGTNIMTCEEVKSHIAIVLNSYWWSSKMPYGVSLTKLNDGRGTNSAMVRFWPGLKFELTIPRWARQRLVILHELSHVMTAMVGGVDDHGPIFCANFLNLVERWLGEPAYIEMESLFDKHKIESRQGELI